MAATKKTASAKKAKKKTAANKSSSRAARSGAKRPKESVEGYINQIPESSRKRFDELRAAVRSAVPAGAVEIISYRIPALADDGVIVWYAAFANHCSLFPTAAVIDAFKDELKPYKLSRGTIHFPLEQPLPAALIRRIVKARVKENQHRKRE